MWASNRERVSGVPTVGHLGKRLGHTPQSCGHATPLLRIKGGEFMSRAVWDVSVPDMTPRCCRRGPFQPHHLSVDWNHVSDVK